MNVSNKETPIFENIKTKIAIGEILPTITT